MKSFINFREMRYVQRYMNLLQRVVVCALLLLMVTPLTNKVHAQGSDEVLVQIVSMKSSYPSNILAYLENPTQFFQIRLTNMTSETKQVYVNLDLHTEMAIDGRVFSLVTTPNKSSAEPITLSPGIPYVFDNFQKFEEHFGGRLETNNTQEDIASIIRLPEGSYSMCAQACEWKQNVTNDIPLGNPGCLNFSICYSASAPEITAPVLGQMMDGNGIAKLTPTRILNFQWTPVVTNCSGTMKFEYIFKMVKVLPGQNINEAITRNATIVTTKQANKTYFQIDTLSNLKFRFEKGATYAVQVQAQQIGSSLFNELVIGNEGKSQIVSFTWGEADYNVDKPNTDVDKDKDKDDAHTKSSSVEEKTNMKQVKNSIRQQYVIYPIRDDNALTDLMAFFSDEYDNIPKVDSVKALDTIDEGVVVLDTAQAYKLQWVPLRGDSITYVKYVANLYEFVGSVDVSVKRPALKTLVIPGQHGQSYPIDVRTPITLSDTTWGNVLQPGKRYYVEVTAMATYNYAKYEIHKETHYVNGIEADTEYDTITEVKSSSEGYRSGVVFQWGIDWSLADKVAPSQFTYPIDQRSMNWEDTLLLNKIYMQKDSALVDKSGDTIQTDTVPWIKRYNDFEFVWNETQNVGIEDTAIYEISLYKMVYGKKVSEILKDSSLLITSVNQIYYTKSKDAKLMKQIETDSAYIARLKVNIGTKNKSTLYKFHNEGYSLPIVFRLVDKEVDKKKAFLCYEDDTAGLSKEIIIPSIDTLVNSRARVHIGRFDMIMQNAKLNKEKKTYSGDGYVIWSPSKYGIGIKVNYYDIKINKDFKVVSGRAVSIEGDSNNYLRLSAGTDWGKTVDKGSNYLVEGYDMIVKELDDGMKEDASYWYDYIQQGANVLSQSTHSFIEDGGAMAVLTMPMQIGDQFMGADSQYVSMGINDAFFTPQTAQMSLIAVYSAPKDNLYIPLVATNICMDPTNIFYDTVGDITLHLLQDVPVELTDGYTMTFKKPSNIEELTDGTFIAFNSEGFQGFGMDVTLDMGTKDQPGNKLLAVDLKQDGMIKNDKPVSARFFAKIKDWDNWVAQIKLDPFAVAGAEDYTFVPTGNGIFYDHSSSETPKDVAFPSGYLHESERNAWQGFYLDKFAMYLPTDISNTFNELSNPDSVINPDSTYVYTYGDSNQYTDSSKYVYMGTRINVSAQQLIIDKDGISVDISANNLISASTYKGGGWSFSLDTVGFKFLRNEYKHGHIDGTMGVPLITGKFKYNLIVATDSLYFNLSPKDKMSLDIFCASLDFAETGTYFHITHDWGGHTYEAKKQGEDTIVAFSKNSTTRVDLTMSGTLNIDFSKFDIPVEIAALKFEKMYFRNFKATKEKIGKETVDAYMFDGFEYSIGAWSKASPQKYVGVDLSKKTDALMEKPGTATASSDAVISGSMGGFKYSIETLKPIFKSAEKSGWKKAGLEFGGSMSLGIGQSTDESAEKKNKDNTIGATIGFAIWCDVNLDDFDVDNFGGRFDSARVKTDIGPLAVDGFIGHSTDDAVYGNSWKGAVNVTLMDKISFAMAAGFGECKKDASDIETGQDSTYSWWYLEGAYSMQGLMGISLGPVSITGIGGGFAYNMKPTKGANQKAEELRKGKGTSGSFADRMVNSSGLEFQPRYDAWLAKCGIALCTTGAPETMSADGILTLRVADGHFAGISLDVVASIMAPYTPGDGADTAKAAIRVGAIIDYTEHDDDSWDLTFAASVKSEIDLTSILNNSLAEKIKSTVSLENGGDSFSKLRNSAKKSDEGKKLDDYLDSIANDPKYQDKDLVSAGMSIMIPIEFSVHHYTESRKDKTDWYIAIGRPKFEDRVTFKANLDLVVMHASTAWTMYVMTGNKFPEGISLPDIPDGVKDILGSKYAKAKSKRSLPTFSDAGGFAFGASFEAHLDFSLLLFVDVNAYLGFDASLLKLRSQQGCEGYSEIGKNDFYGMGQIYAALDGKAGLELNLGFWKGRLTLVEAAIGALLQGGGPQPTWAYGLLAFRASCLNGLIKINTSVDFSLGHVCIPGASDPLANVHLFESVTPSFPSEAEANKKDNLITPFSMGIIMSNLPWNEDVLLSATDYDGNTNNRKFCFVLDTKKTKAICTDRNKSNSKASSYNKDRSSSTVANLKFKASQDDKVMLLFENRSGGFYENSNYEVTLVGRAFEWRNTSNHKMSQYHKTHDYPYELYGNVDRLISTPSFTQLTTNDPQKLAWRDPIYLDNDMENPKKFEQDTVIYFSTQSAPDNLDNQVIYTWPYNGDPQVPIDELYKSNGRYQCLIYINQDVAILNPNKLDSENRRMKVFLLDGSIGKQAKSEECQYEYHPNGFLGSSYPCIQVSLPADFGKHYSTSSRYALRLMLVDNQSYQKALDMMSEDVSNKLISTQTTQEKQSRDVDELRRRLAAKKGAQSQTNQKSQTSSQFGNNQYQRNAASIDGKYSTNLGKSGNQYSSSTGRNKGSQLGNKPLVLSGKSGVRVISSSNVANPKIKTKVGKSGIVKTSNRQSVSSAQSKITPKTSVYSRIQVSDLEQQNMDMELAQLETAVATYDSVADTAMMIERKKLNSPYSACLLSGKSVYTLYFRIVSGWTTYAEWIDRMSPSMFYYNIDINNTKFEGQCIESYAKYTKIEKQEDFEAARAAYLFAPYEPDDPKLYKQGIVLPPILYAVKSSHAKYPYNDPTDELYDIYIQEFNNFNKALKNTTVPYTMPHQSNSSFDKGKEKLGRDYGFNTEYDRNVINTMYKTGILYDYTGSDFDNLGIHYMIGSGNDIYQNVKGGDVNRLPIREEKGRTIYQYPGLLQFELSDPKMRLDSLSISNENLSGNDRYKLSNGDYISEPKNSYAAKVTILDYATPTIYSDLKKYNTFFQECFDNAYYHMRRGWSHKRSETKYLYKSGKYNTFTFTSIPFTFYKSYYMSWYIHAFNSIHTLHHLDKRHPYQDGQAVSHDDMIRYGSAESVYWQDHAIRFTKLPYKIEGTKGIMYKKLFTSSTKKSNGNYGYLRSDWFKRSSSPKVSDFTNVKFLKDIEGIHYIEGRDIPETGTILTHGITFYWYDMNKSNNGTTGIGKLVNYINERASNGDSSPYFYANTSTDADGKFEYRTKMEESFRNSLFQSLGLLYRDTDDEDEVDGWYR